VRFWLVVFSSGLVLSGVTAFPLQTELGWLAPALRGSLMQQLAQSGGLLRWIDTVNEGVRATNARYSFLAYGTDWLAFAHLVIAVAFIGPYIDPVRNKWVITFGLIACWSVFPLALIAGQIRGIPFVWRLIDCSFGVFGSIPLLRCRWLIVKIERTMYPAVREHGSSS
jgi:succinate-acetate transporter protein